ncbi:MAG: ATP-binding protein [Acidobacteriota bacterium]
MSGSHVDVEELEKIPVFAELAADQRAWLAEHGEVTDYESGESVFELGHVAEHMFAVLEGAIEIVFNVGGQLVPFVTQRPGTVSGLLPFSRMRSFSGSGRAVGPTRLYRLHQSFFDEMLHRAPTLGPVLVSMMTDRVRETTRLAQQREKMMALGKLSAGLAHELNNPATAVRRDADALDQQLARLPELTRMLLVHGIDAEALGRGGAWLAAWARGTARAASEAASEATTPGALERSRLEQQVGVWLDERGVNESWLLVEPLVGAGLSPDHLCQLTDGVAAAALSDFVTWFTAIIGAQTLARDIRVASGRMTELVGSVKVYSHMDRAGDRERTDLREGIDSTLVMLGHKLKRKHITLERDYAPDLPAVSAFAGELNQVWTNLADNAIDAMPDDGVLRVETARDGGTAVVRVVDNGAGIPPEIQARIFEAFFTTKPIGEGTGLGLDIVQRIVAQQHGGTVDVESAPGRTVFTVRLPIDPNG